MEIFRLFGSIFVDNSEANESISRTGREAEGAQGKLGKFFSALKTGAIVAGKAAVAGLAAGATAFSALSVKALQLGGELEQNLGGAEAAFGKFANTLKQKGETAFKDMGLSMSDFLATSNKMGSLFQGAGFGIEESMNLSTQAMQRAADVASIMGIDTSAAMEAIAGAAKGNFTMMDNLGVAMNDTAIGAYAASKGIDKSTQAMSQQEKIGLAMEMFLEKTTYATGNYAKENETLAGSLGTTKAALTNFLSGAGNIEDVISSATNLAGIVARNLSEIIPRLANELPKVFTALEPLLPPLFDTLLPAIFEGAAKLVTGLAQGIIDNLPMILGAAQNITLSILEGIGDVAPILKPITSALGFLVENLDAVMMAVIPLTAAFAAYKATLAIGALISALTNGTAALAAAQGIATAAQYALNLAMSLNPIGLVVAAIAALTAGIIYLWNTNEDFRNALINAWNAIKETASIVWKTITKFFTEDMPNALMKLPDTFKNIGKNMIEGLWNGIGDKIEWLKGKVLGVVDKIKGWFTGKDGFDTHSPSLWAKKIGGFVSGGFAIGMTDSINDVISAAKNISAAVGESIKTDYKFDIGGLSGDIDYGMNFAAGFSANNGLKPDPANTTITTVSDHKNRPINIIIQNSNNINNNLDVDMISRKQAQQITNALRSLGVVTT